jgi:hypothetical protein
MKEKSFITLTPARRQADKSGLQRVATPITRAASAGAVTAVVHGELSLIYTPKV